jgi:uncharacterized membrane protein YccC
MNTPETKLTIESCNGALSLDPSLSFNHANREVFRITHDGHMITGEGLSVNAATQEAAKLLISAFEEQIQEMVDARAEKAEAELVQLRAENESSCKVLRQDAEHNAARAEKAEAALAASRYETVQAAQEGLRECIRAEKAEAALQKIKDVMREDSNGKDPMDAVEDIVTAAASQIPARSESKSPCPATD